MALDIFGSIADLAKSIIDRVIPDPAQKLAAQMKLAELAQTGELARLTADTDLAKAQLAIDQAEAQSDSRFKSWWRPALGWVCVLCFALNFLAFPCITAGFAIAGHSIILPVIDAGTFMPVLLGMLGLAATRSYDKAKGVV